MRRDRAVAGIASQDPHTHGVTASASSAEGTIDGRELAAWAGFLKTHAQLTRKLDGALQASHGIPLIQFDVLLQLRLHGGRLRMSGLADVLMLSRSGITGLVDQLERRGWVERRRDPEDGRSLHAVLTSSGRAALTRAQKAHAANVRRHFVDPLSPGQLATLARVWRTLETHARSEV